MNKTLTDLTASLRTMPSLMCRLMSGIFFIATLCGCVARRVVLHVVDKGGLPVVHAAVRGPLGDHPQATTNEDGFAELRFRCWKAIGAFSIDSNGRHWHGIIDFHPIDGNRRRDYIVNVDVDGVALSTEGLPRSTASHVDNAYDAELAASRFGIDYKALLSRANRGESDAIEGLMRVCAVAGFDGAASEDWSDDLDRVLRAIGDERFAHELAQQSDGTREQVLVALRFDWGELEVPPGGSTPTAALYPRTFALEQHKP